MGHDVCTCLPAPCFSMTCFVCMTLPANTAALPSPAAQYLHIIDPYARHSPACTNSCMPRCSPHLCSNALPSISCCPMPAGLHAFRTPTPRQRAWATSHSSLVPHAASLRSLTEGAAPCALRCFHCMGTAAGIQCPFRRAPNNGARR